MIAQRFNRQRSFVIFDLETTTPNPENARIVSIAMRVHKPDGQVRPFKSLINPGCPIPEESSKVHGITNDIVKTGCAFCWKEAAQHPHEDCPEFKRTPAFRELADGILKGFKNADFGGYNIKQFDLPVIQNEFRRINLSFDYSQALVIDGFRLWQKLEPRTLTDAVKRWVGREMKAGAHDAMVDTVESEAVLLAQLDYNTTPKTLEEIHKLCFPRHPSWVDSEGKFIFINGEACFNFGKNKGKPIKHFLDYLRWMYGGNFSPEVKAICDQALAGKFPVAPQG